MNVHDCKLFSKKTDRHAIFQLQVLFSVYFQTVGKTKQQSPHGTIDLENVTKWQNTGCRTTLLKAALHQCAFASEQDVSVRCWSTFHEETADVSRVQSEPGPFSQLLHGRELWQTHHPFAPPSVTTNRRKLFLKGHIRKEEMACPPLARTRLKKYTALREKQED